MVNNSESQDQSNATAEIAYEEETLILPKRMTLERVIELLNSRQKHESNRGAVQETFDVLLLDGACPLYAVRRYGWTPSTTTPGFFHDNPPNLMSVDVGIQSGKAGELRTENAGCGEDGPIDHTTRLALGVI